MINIARGRQKLGQFSENDVIEGLKSGKFLPTDLAWRKPMSDWKPLSEFTELLDTESAPPLPNPVEKPVSSPPISRRRFSSGDPSWERRAQVGFFSGLFKSVSEVLLEPGRTFESMKRTGGFWNPLLYYMIWTFLSALVALGYELAFDAMLFRGVSLRQQEAATTELVPMWVIVLLVALSPVLVVIWAFLSSAALHVSLKAVGGASRPYETSFRVVCYACGSALALQVIPFCGGLIYAIWAMVCLVIGFQRTHQTDWQRAVVAVLLPMVVLIGLALVVAIFVTQAISGGGEKSSFQ